MSQSSQNPTNSSAPNVQHLDVDIKVKMLVCLFAILTGISIAFVGCETPQKQSVERIKKTKLPGEPLIRVRVNRAVESVVITSPSTIQIFAKGSTRPQLFSTPATVSFSNGQWRVKTRTMATFIQRTLNIEPLGPASIAVNRVIYPGKIRMVSPSNVGTGFDVVSDVRLELYLPGVLDQELYDSWSPATYLAQAIIARSYAIDRIINYGPGKHYDVNAGQSSQAYIGASTNRLAIRSVLDTAGMVLTHNRQIFPAFYSSTCGGVTQAADIAFESKYAAPLNVVGKHPWCSSSKHYSWGPIYRDKQILAKRIAAWGLSHQLSIARLGHLHSIQVSQFNRYKRPSVFMLMDTSGKRYQLNAESFRHACNYSGLRMGLKAVPTKAKLKSSFVEIRNTGKQFVFDNGHGFGHGVGLCQYGAEGMAKAGKNVKEILFEYYPGALIERAY